MNDTRTDETAGMMIELTPELKQKITPACEAFIHAVQATHLKHPEAAVALMMLIDSFGDISGIDVREVQALKLPKEKA